jgi:hypothetical protein
VVTVEQSATVAGPFTGVEAIEVASEEPPFIAGYLPGSRSGSTTYTVIGKNKRLEDLEAVEGTMHVHFNGGKNVKMTAYCLKNSETSGLEGCKTCQFQYNHDTRIECLFFTFRQNGNNVEAYASQYRTYLIYKAGHEDEAVIGMDFEKYSSTTTPSRSIWNTFATSNSHDALGVQDLKLEFKTSGVNYTAVSTAAGANDLVFTGSEEVPLTVTTTADALFPSNAVVTVNPYASLTLAGHKANACYTQYRVITNGTLCVKGTWQTHDEEQVNLVGGTLSVREDEPSAADSGTYFNYLTLADGARVKGKPVRIGRNGVLPSWLVTGALASQCETKLVFAARQGDAALKMRFNVNDVAEGDDFAVLGGLQDFHSFDATSSGYWNVSLLKNGAGTMAVSGTVQLPNEIEVAGGTLRLAGGCTFVASRKRQEDGSMKKAAICSTVTPTPAQKVETPRP